jgi:hypothetical protein
MKKSCYIINFYLGNRRKTIKKYTNEDRLCFLKKQIELLEKYTHNLNKIIFNFNIESSHYHYFTEIFRITPKYIQSTPIEINVRINQGMSYGAWSDLYIDNKDQYEYFIFNEDDYFFIQNNWDQYLIDKFNSFKDAGYLCAVAREPDHWNGYKKHAAHSTSISSNKILSQILDHHNCLPHPKTSEYNKIEKFGQIDQSFSVIKLGYNIYDIRDDYRVSFGWTEPDKVDIHRFFWWNDKDLLLPAFLIFDHDRYHWYSNNDYEFKPEHISSTSEEALTYFQQKISYWKKYE